MPEKAGQIDNETPSFMDTMIINKGESQRSTEKEADGGINYISSEQIGYEDEILQLPIVNHVSTRSAGKKTTESAIPRVGPTQIEQYLENAAPEQPKTIYNSQVQGQGTQGSSKTPQPQSNRSKKNSQEQ